MSYAALIWNDYSQNALFNDFWQFCHDKVFQPKQKYKKASPIVFHLFGVAFGLLQVVLRFSSLFQPVLACYGTFQVVLFLQTTTSQNALIMKFIKKYKVAQGSSQSGTVLMYYKKSKCYYKVRQLFCTKKPGK